MVFDNARLLKKLAFVHVKYKKPKVADFFYRGIFSEGIK